MGEETPQSDLKPLFKPTGAGHFVTDDSTIYYKIAQQLKKNILFIVGVLLLPVAIIAQSSYGAQANTGLQPVYWKYEVKKVSDKTYELHLTAFIKPGWHLYAQQQPADAIALPTSIKFNDNPVLAFNGQPKEIGKLEKFTVPSIGISAWQYEGKVDFVQVVKLKKDIPASITGSIEFQSCTDEQCLPPETVSFNIALNN